jgi:hypothetical protein
MPIAHPEALILVGMMKGGANHALILHQSSPFRGGESEIGSRFPRTIEICRTFSRDPNLHFDRTATRLKKERLGIPGHVSRIAATVVVFGSGNLDLPPFFTKEAQTQL